ncbi:hypothetical protein JCM5296_005272 [Sporobolomyces johnsonii]
MADIFSVDERRGTPSGGASAVGEGLSLRKLHVKELADIGSASAFRASLVARAKRNVPLSFVSYLLRTVTAWFWTLLTSPASILLDPLSTFASLIIYPVVWIGLGYAVGVFWIASLLGGGKLIDWAGRKWANGYSMVNWPNPQIFGQQSIDTIQAARPMLSGKYKTTVPPQAHIDDDNPMFGTARTARLFSLPLARSLLLMSALVYERNDNLVTKASGIATDAQKCREGSEEKHRLLRQADALLDQSEKVIRQQAERWGLRYDGVSDLASVAGPFASIFYTSSDRDEKPFIVLVFKGTGPQNFAEFLVDATINRVPAGVFFGAGAGTCHEGFYQDLFMQNQAGGSKADSDGYGTIVGTLKHVAMRMKRDLVQGRRGGDPNMKIPLWVTGHSLGSALSSLCYARFLRSPADLGDDIELRDSYNFGTPRLGDGNFVSAFEQSLVTPRDRCNILWRVQNCLDAVTMVPPGLADTESNRSTLSVVSVLNYAHLGPCMVLRPIPFRTPYYRVDEGGAFHEAVDVQVVGDHYEGEIEREQETAGGIKVIPSAKMLSSRLTSLEQSGWKNPLRWALATVPPSFYHHFPASYLHDLELMQTSADQKVAAGRERRQSADG